MQASSPAAFSLAQTAIVSLVTLAAIAVLVLTLAYWAWGWLAPPVVQPVPVAVPEVSSVAEAQGLFGIAKTNSSKAEPVSGRVSLLGVVAAHGSEPGYAVLRLDTKQTVTVRRGGEFEPGVRLAEVHAEHVVLERDGIRETLAWPNRASPTEQLKPPSRPAPAYPK